MIQGVLWGIGGLCCIAFVYIMIWRSGKSVFSRILYTAAFSLAPVLLFFLLGLVSAPVLMNLRDHYPLYILRDVVLPNPDIPDRDIAAALSGEDGDVLSRLWDLVPSPTGTDPGVTSRQD